MFAYTFLFLLLSVPYWGLGDVIAPHRQFAELGATTDSTGAPQRENRKFSDFTNGYIPEIQEHLKAAHSGWLTCWTTQNEFGRPFFHTAGFSAAYLPSWVLSKITNKPWWFITILSLFSFFLTGVFLILFCRERGISPLAALIIGFKAWETEWTWVSKGAKTR